MSVSLWDTLRPVLPYTAAAKRPLRERSDSSGLVCYTLCITKQLRKWVRAQPAGFAMNMSTSETERSLPPEGMLMTSPRK